MKAHRRLLMFALLSGLTTGLRAQNTGDIAGESTVAGG